MYDLYVYGSGECDQLGVDLGDNEDMETSTPKKLDLLNLEPNLKIYKICCGGLHTLALSTSGHVFSWGCNDDYALGRGGEEKTPLQVKGMDVPITDISCGDSYSIAYNSEQNVIYLWGSYRARSGKIGQPIKEPINFKQEIFGKEGIKKAICGQNHTVLLTKEKTVYAWGNDESGQTGKEPEEKDPNDENRTDHLIPNKLSSIDVEDIFVGGNHSFLITINDNRRKLKAWGCNSYGQLGNDSQENSFIPVEVHFDSHVSILSATGGEDHSLALTEDKQVYAWGRNDDNQCGFMTGRDQAISIVPEGEKKKDFFTIPRMIDFFNRDNVVTEIRSTMHFNYAFNPESGKTFSWGLGENYVLGNKQYQNEKVPFEIPKEFFNNLHPADIALGSQHVVVALFDPVTGIKRPTFEFEASGLVKKEEKVEEEGAVRRKEPGLPEDKKEEVNDAATPKKKTPFKMEVYDKNQNSASKQATTPKKFITTTPKKQNSEKKSEKKEDDKMEIDEEKKVEPIVEEEKKEDEDKDNKMEVEEEKKTPAKKSTNKEPKEKSINKKSPIGKKIKEKTEKKSRSKSVTKKDKSKEKKEKSKPKKSAKKSKKEDSDSSSDEEEEKKKTKKKSKSKSKPKKEESKAKKPKKTKKFAEDEESSDEEEEERKTNIKVVKKKTTKKEEPSSSDSEEEKQKKKKTTQKSKKKKEDSSDSEDDKPKKKKTTQKSKKKKEDSSDSEDDKPKKKTTKKKEDSSDSEDDKPKKKTTKKSTKKKDESEDEKQKKKKTTKKETKSQSKPKKEKSVKKTSKKAKVEKDSEAEDEKPKKKAKSKSKSKEKSTSKPKAEKTSKKDK